MLQLIQMNQKATYGFHPVSLSLQQFFLNETLLNISAIIFHFRTFLHVNFSLVIKQPHIPAAL